MPKKIDIYTAGKAVVKVTLCVIILDLSLTTAVLAAYRNWMSDKNLFLQQNYLRYLLKQERCEGGLEEKVLFIGFNIQLKISGKDHDKSNLFPISSFTHLSKCVRSYQ